MQQNNRTTEIYDIIKANHTRKELATILDDYHESDIASVLDLLTKEERQQLYKSLTLDRMSDIFSYLDDATKYFEEM